MTGLASTCPLNCWYVAATSDEVGDQPLGRRLLDRPVVLYRQESGSVAAFEDRCAHRAFPLSLGHVEGDLLVCAYHGFAYDAAGTCVRVPSQPHVPPGVCVRRFPVREEPPFVWIWLGRPEGAGTSAPPRLRWFYEDGWTAFGLNREVASNYMLLHEHYLDLTNVFVMHPEAVPPGIETLPPLDEVEVSEMSVSYSRALPAARLADWEAEATGLSRDTEYARREEGTFVSPALHVQRYAIDADDGRAYEQLRIQGFTPEGPATTHVFLQIARNYATDRAVVGDHLRALFHEMAARDTDVLETVQRQLGDEVEPRRDLNVKADRAAVRARRVAQSMVEEEAGRGALRPILAGAGG
jgi:phenylpropionate dioxygenase-like ring-hydroxylating dioxygenase large terminal subunit